MLLNLNPWIEYGRLKDKTRKGINFLGARIDADILNERVEYIIYVPAFGWYHHGVSKGILICVIMWVLCIYADLIKIVLWVIHEPGFTHYWAFIVNIFWKPLCMYVLAVNIITTRNILIFLNGKMCKNELFCHLKHPC